jgi:hypothetical protein
MSGYIDMGGRNPGSIEQALPIGYNLPVTAGTEAGDVVLISQMVVYAQEDRDSDGYATCYIPAVFVEVVTVYGRSDGANSAVAVGDKLYYDLADGQINKDSTHGVEFGYALGAVTSGSSGEIAVAFSQ